MKTLAVIFYKYSVIITLLLMLTANTIFLVGCGRVGPPLPPIKYKALVPELLQVRQRGTNLVLTWPKPSAISLQNSKVLRAEILRRDENPNTPPRLPEETFLAEARIVGTLTIKDISAVESNVLSFNDNLVETALTSDVRYRYAIRYSNFSGVPLPLSNYAFLEPISQVARPPENLATELSQDAIKLSWNAPTNNLDNTSPARVVGYNIYRRTKDNNFPDQPINTNPIIETSFEDRQFKFGGNYSYIIRSISPGKDSTIESPDSAEISVKAKDTFAPSSPANVTGAAAASVVSLFWPANTEKDLRGYLIYRADRQDMPQSEWTKLTPSPITTTTFRDERAKVGQIYYYFIIAIDTAGNESKPSSAVEVEVVQ